MLGLSLGQILDLLEVGVKIAVGAVFQPEDDVVLGLKSVEEVDEVLVFYGEENVLLVLQHLYLLRCGYRVLTDEL